MSSSFPILYSFRRCPYAMRARMAIFVSGQTCELREVVLRDKPAEMVAASPKATVPVLVLPDGRVVDESIRIMKWALGKSDPGGWLSPSVGDSGPAIESLVRENDTTFKYHLDRYKYPNRYDDADPGPHRENGLRFLATLEERLRITGFLCDDRLSFADVAIAPFVRQFAYVDKSWFDTLEMPALQRWLVDFLGSGLFAGIMEKHPKWQPGNPVIWFGGGVTE